MKKLMVAGCMVLALIILGSCAPKGEKYDENTASDYDYVSENMKISDGIWSNNWATSWDDGAKVFVPTIESRKYLGLTIYLGIFHTREPRFEVAKPDGPVYVEIYLIYDDETGAEVSKLVGEAERDRLFTMTMVGWNVKMDFDHLPATTKALKFKVQKDRETIYLESKFLG